MRTICISLLFLLNILTHFLIVPVAASASLYAASNSASDNDPIVLKGKTILDPNLSFGAFWGLWGIGAYTSVDYGRVGIELSFARKPNDSYLNIYGGYFTHQSQQAPSATIPSVNPATGALFFGWNKYIATAWNLGGMLRLHPIDALNGLYIGVGLRYTRMTRSIMSYGKKYSDHYFVGKKGLENLQSHKKLWTFLTTSTLIEESARQHFSSLDPNTIDNQNTTNYLDKAIAAMPTSDKQEGLKRKIHDQSADEGTKKQYANLEKVNKKIGWLRSAPTQASRITNQEVVFDPFYTLKPFIVIGYRYFLGVSMFMDCNIGLQYIGQDVLSIDDLEKSRAAGKITKEDYTKTINTLPYVLQQTGMCGITGFNLGKYRFAPTFRLSFGYAFE